MWERGDTQEYNRLAGTQIWEQEQTTSPPAGPEEENDGCVVLPVAQLSKPNGSVFQLDPWRQCQQMWNVNLKLQTALLTPNNPTEH